MENNFGLRSIAEVQKKGFFQAYGERLKEAYTHDWVFYGWERLLILTCVLWTVFSIGKWLWRII